MFGIFLSGLLTGTVIGQYALSDIDLEKFQCRKNAWQLPQSCGSSCTESDKTTLSYVKSI